jgi:snurportin-1
MMTVYPDDVALTLAVDVNGVCFRSFPSNLPGGSRKQRSPLRDNCIIDCIYEPITRTFYILDIMSWKGHDFFDSELECRNWMMHSKCEEEELTTRNAANPYIFRPM